MYKINEFADMIGVSAKTLRNKHNSGILIPSYVDPKSNHRFYSDELAYRYINDKSVFVYQSTPNYSSKLEHLKKELEFLKLKYQIFTNTELNNDFFNNMALRKLLKEVSKSKTFTILYDEENIFNNDLTLIRFYINSCFPNVKIKEIEQFSFEKPINLAGGDCNAQ